MKDAPLNIGNRRELFLDRHLIDSLDNTALKMGTPRREENVMDFDRPWEGRFVGSTNVLKDDDCYRMYYRCSGYGEDGKEDILQEQTAYAESRDGINWVKPELGLHEFDGSTKNNLILPDGDERRISHNFMVFKDTRAGVPDDERYKGVGGSRQHGLFRLVSADGIRWRMFSDGPTFARGRIQVVVRSFAVTARSAARPRRIFLTGPSPSAWTLALRRMSISIRTARTPTSVHRTSTSRCRFVMWMIKPHSPKRRWTHGISISIGNATVLPMRC